MAKVVINTDDISDLVSNIAADCAALDSLDDASAVDDAWYHSESIQRALWRFNSIADSAERVE